jgi:hypothetical protein
MKVTRNFKVYGVLLAASLVLSACGSNSSIEAAQKFGDLASQFGDNTNRLADDIYGSCIRRIQYIQMDTATSNEARNEALRQCEDLNKPASQQAKDANKVVVDYITTIGKLASDDVVSFDAQFERLENSLRNFSIPVERASATGTETVNFTLPSEAIDTGISIANFIFGWASNRFREGTLREAVTCTDRPLQTYITGLDYAFREGYIDGLLAQELSRVNSYYDYYAVILRNTDGSDREFRDLQRESFNAIEGVLQKRNAAIAYMAILDKTADAHANLAKIFLDDANHPSAASCANYFNAGQSNATFTSEEGQSEPKLSAEELAQIRQIVINYQESVEPLLEQMEEALSE